MKIRNVVTTLMVLLIFVLASCGGKAPDAMDKPGDTMMEQPTESAMMDSPTADAMMSDATPTADAMMVKETPTPDAMMMQETPTAEAMLEMPNWFGASLTDVRTGKTFMVSDFKDKVVLVETMAVWCSNCFQQQKQIQSLHETLGMRDDFVSISLDIDPNEDAAILTAFTQKNSGFDWMYAVAGADVARELGNTYGDQFLNPPSAPVFVIDRHGEVHPLPFGIKSADDLMKAIQPYLDGTM